VVKDLLLVSFHCGSREALLDELARELSAAFGETVKRSGPAFDPEEAFDPARGQYDSRTLLALLLERHPRSARVLGITDVDLFIPALTYVFGEAQLGGRAAVVSCYRLAPERYGLPPNEARLQARLTKEAIHELGHTVELLHCSDARCVMASSPAVEGIDLKSSRFCGRCRRQLDRADAEDGTG
jgi:archaemetzincin